MLLQVAVDHLDHMKRPDRTDLQLAAVKPSGVAQQVVRLQFQQGDALSDRQQLPTDIRQFNPPPTAMEQLNIVLTFQGLHLRGQRRLA